MIVKNKYIIIISAIVLGLGISAFSIQRAHALEGKQIAQKAPATNGQAVEKNVETQAAGKEVTVKAASSTAADTKKTPGIITYTVKSGDTLSSIARQYGIDINTIVESNNLNARKTLKLGQKLSFPSVKGVLYTVKSGETLSDIADSYNIVVKSIVAANSLGSANRLKIGQTLILPGADKITAANADSNVPSQSTKVVKTASKSKVTSKTVHFSRGGRNSSLGSLIWPVSGPITSGFGYRGSEFHTGIDIGVPQGTHVKAALSGVVKFAGWDGGYGNLVILDNGGGVETYYAHNSRLLVHEGQAISQGDVISLSGETGRATGPHVHFEIRINDNVVNPFNYL